MKVVENTPDRLIAKAVPVTLVWGSVVTGGAIVGAFIFGLLTGALGEIAVFALLFVTVLLGFMVAQIDKVTVTLDRETDTLHISHRSINGLDEATFKLHDIIEANVWENLDPRHLLWQAYLVNGVRPPPKLAIILATSDPPDIHVVSGWRDGESATVAVANAINAWLSMDIDSNQRQA